MSLLPVTLWRRTGRVPKGGWTDVSKWSVYVVPCKQNGKSKPRQWHAGDGGGVESGVPWTEFIEGNTTVSGVPINYRTVQLRFFSCSTHLHTDDIYLGAVLVVNGWKLVSFRLRLCRRYRRRGPRNLLDRSVTVGVGTNSPNWVSSPHPSTERGKPSF